MAGEVNGLEDTCCRGVAPPIPGSAVFVYMQHKTPPPPVRAAWHQSAPPTPGVTPPFIAKSRGQILCVITESNEESNAERYRGGVSSGTGHRHEWDPTMASAQVMCAQIC